MAQDSNWDLNEQEANVFFEKLGTRLREIETGEREGEKGLTPDNAAIALVASVSVERTKAGKSDLSDKQKKALTQAYKETFSEPKTIGFLKKLARVGTDSATFSLGAAALVFTLTGLAAPLITSTLPIMVFHVAVCNLISFGLSAAEKAMPKITPENRAEKIERQTREVFTKSKSHVGGEQERPVPKKTKG